MQWIKKNQKEVLVFLLILLFAAFFRFYKIDQYMTFLGDEGRDAIVVKKLLTEGDLPFIGPQSSVGSLYLGPLYYYMMAIPMAIFWMNPVAAAGMVALIGVATVGLIYYLSRVWFGIGAAIIASILYAVSPITIIYSKSSWNPNPTPFFALLGLLALHFAHSQKDYRYLILTGAAAAAALQMHYLALILIPTYGAIWLYELLVEKIKKKSHLKYFWTGTVGGILAFLILMSPLFLFDLKHDYMNYHGFVKLLSGEGSTVKFSLLDSLSKTIPIYFRDYIMRYITAGDEVRAFFVTIISLIPIVWMVRQAYKKREVNWPIIILTVWLIIGLLGLSFYQSKVIDHYLMFLNPVVYLLMGASYFVFEKLQKSSSGKFNYPMIFMGYVLILVLFNLLASPLLSSPNRQLQRTQQVAQAIINETGDQPYNFALIAEKNYDLAYQFYLDEYKHKPKLLPDEKTDQLIVVCEDAVCQPTTNPKYEVAAFGMSKIEWEKEVAGLKLFKLVPNPTGAP